MVEPFLYHCVQLWFPLGRRCSKTRDDTARAEGQGQRHRAATALEFIEELLWIGPKRQLSPTQPGTGPPSVGKGQKKGVKGRKLMGSDKGSLTGRIKAIHTQAK